jgi:type IV pilus assembly protein PilZ
MTESPDQTRPGSNGNAMLSISIRDLDVLYCAWMPFLENGGLFIPTPKNYAMGDEVFMLCALMEEPERIPVTGTVAWITPANAESNRARGIGVQFKDRDNPARPVIEKYLAGMVDGKRPTHTI